MSKRNKQRDKHKNQYNNPPSRSDLSELKNLGGRPEKDFNQNQFKELCQMQCTSEEIAAVLGITRQTLYNKVKKLYGVESYDTIYQELRIGGHASLRRAQWHSAIRDRNVSMQKFLGEQYLGQESVSRQKIEAEVTAKLQADIESKVRAEITQELNVYGTMTNVQATVDLTNLSEEELDALERIASKLAKPSAD